MKTGDEADFRTKCAFLIGGGHVDVLVNSVTNVKINCYLRPSFYYTSYKQGVVSLFPF